MPKINLLDDLTINKIAAGEVIERPSSIIKELVENSLDAQSTSINIQIENGGKDLIKIIDNGIGIEHDDVNKAFMRHATSKINRVEDLYCLNSLGFRGEALASICAVSKMKMVTKFKEEMTGTEIIVNGGKVISKEVCAANTGTQITVASLFYNTPARRKFLRSNQSETQAITDLVSKLAIGNPNVRFTYFNNNKLVFETSGNGSLSNTIRSIYGKDISDNLIKLNFSSDLFEISGYIANNNIYRSNRNMQHIFINGRYVKSSNIMSIINESYKSIIPINKFPVYFINLKVDPAKIDVNIHPNKLEVKFDNEDVILNELSDYIRGTLMKNSLVGRFVSKKDGYSSKNNYSQYNTFTYTDENVSKKEIVNALDLIDTTVKESNFEINKTINTVKNNDLSKISSSENGAKVEKTNEFKSLNDYDKEIKPLHLDDTKDKEILLIEDEPAKHQDFANLKFIGILFDTYLLFSKKEEFYMVDQHAAHERVGFEMYMKQFKSNELSIQLLVEPVIMELSANDMIKVTSNLEVFEKFGFVVEEFGHRNISIRGVPNSFGIPECERFIYEIIDNLGKINSIYDTKYDEIAEIACKSSIKANDKIGYNEAIELIDMLKDCENPYTCPHGRPIMIKLTKYEIEKMFKRIM